MISLTDADKLISENQIEKYYQLKRNYDIWTCPVTPILAFLCSGSRFCLKENWILFGLSYRQIIIIISNVLFSPRVAHTVIFQF